MALRGMPSNLADGRRLDEGGAAFSLIARKPERAVGAHAREDDADAALLLVVGERAEEEVDRQVAARAGRSAASRCRTPCKSDRSLFGGIT